MKTLLEGLTLMCTLVVMIGGCGLDGEHWLGCLIAAMVAFLIGATSAYFANEL